MRIVIFGAGVYGMALSRILSRNHHSVRFYDPLKIPVTLEPVVRDAECLVLAMPSSKIMSVLNSLPDYAKNLPIISASKGLLYSDDLPDNYSILFGPAFAVDLDQQKLVTFTITNPLAARLFMADNISFQYSDDLTGAMLLSVLKNIYAVTAGSLALIKNTANFAQFINTTSRELKKALAFYKCNFSTLELACGMPDLMLTCSSPKSRNYKLGQQISLAKEFEILETTESLNIVKTYGEELLKIPDTPVLHDTIKEIQNFINISKRNATQ